MRPVLICAVILCILASVDLWYSSKLNAAVHEMSAVEMMSEGISGRTIATSRPSSSAVTRVSRTPSAPAILTIAATEDAKEDSVQLVESALNSRYMQWGAVGVMLGLFCWLITKHLPNQDKMRREEMESVRDSFLESIKHKDEYFIREIRDIRKSVESHVEKLADAKDKQAAALSELAQAVNQVRQ